MRILILILFHLAIGFVGMYFPVVIVFGVFAFIIYSVDRINRHKNEDGWAHLAAGYLVGCEIYLRAMRFVFPWEFGKYSVIAILLLGMILGRNQKRELPSSALAYFFLLVPSLFIIDFPDFSSARDQIAFNLSGPLSLFVSWLYFYKRNINFQQLSQFIRLTCLPLFAYVARILYRLPNLATYHFIVGSDSKLAGGFGANQVATVMAFGVTIIAVALVLKIPVFMSRAMDIAVTVIFFGFSVLTFSRGGLFSALAAVGTGAIYYTLRTRKSSMVFNFVLIIAAFSIAGFYGWKYLNNLTGQRLGNRYEDTFNPSKLHQQGTETGFYLSDRDIIARQDFEVFKLYPILGIGPGMSAIVKQKLGMWAAAPHTELTRLIAEHGIFGLGALLILLLTPTARLRSGDSIEGKAFFIVTFIFAITAMLHSAMRTAIPGFIFGLGFINLSDVIQNPLMKRQLKVKPQKEKVKVLLHPV